MGGIAESYGGSIFNLTRISALFSIVAVPIYSSGFADTLYQTLPMDHLDSLPQMSFPSCCCKKPLFRGSDCRHTP